MVTIKDVARLAGVSSSTASRALNGQALVDPRTRERVLQCADELNYRPNALAKGLKEGKTKTLAFLIPNIENLIYPSLAISVETEARKHGYFVVFCNTQDDQAREREYVENLKNHFVDGFLFSTALDGMESCVITELREQGYPTVCLMRSPGDEQNSFISDNEYGAYLGTSFLIEQGFTQIATITGRSCLRLYRERLTGYCRALREHGLPENPELIWDGAENGREQGYDITAKKLQSGCVPQAIFAQSDPLAIDAMQAIHAAGLHIPGDISVLGYDNVNLAARYTPALTTVEQPLHRMGQMATRHLIDMIEGRVPANSPACRFPPQIIQRESVKLSRP